MNALLVCFGIAFAILLLIIYAQDRVHTKLSLEMHALYKDIGALNIENRTLKGELEANRAQ